MSDETIGQSEAEQLYTCIKQVLASTHNMYAVVHNFVLENHPDEMQDLKVATVQMQSFLKGRQDRLMVTMAALCNMLGNIAIYLVDEMHSPDDELH